MTHSCIPYVEFARAEPELCPWYGLDIGMWPLARSLGELNRAVETSRAGDLHTGITTAALFLYSAKKTSLYLPRRARH